MLDNWKLLSGKKKSHKQSICAQDGNSIELLFTYVSLFAA